MRCCPSFAASRSTALALLLLSSVLSAQEASSVCTSSAACLTVHNDTGQRLVAKLIGPLNAEMVLEPGFARSLRLPGGRYHVRARYGSAPHYEYRKTLPFTVAGGAPGEPWPRFNSMRSERPGLRMIQQQPKDSSGQLVNFINTELWLRSPEESPHVLEAITERAFGDPSLSQNESCDPKLPCMIFENKSGERALVKVVGPSTHLVEVPDMRNRGVNVWGGRRYVIRVRYGSAGKYRHTQGDAFDMEYGMNGGGVRITLHPVANGNYRTRRIEASAF